MDNETEGKQVFTLVVDRNRSKHSCKIKRVTEKHTIENKALFSHLSMPAFWILAVGIKTLRKQGIGIRMTQVLSRAE